MYTKKRPQPHNAILTRRRVVTLLVVIMCLWFGRSLLRSRHIKVAARTWHPTHPQSICLDAGHGGIDVGANNGRLTEKDLNLKTALMVRDRLHASGYRVYMTRSTDRTMTNNDRYSYCNRNHTTILVSIHHNFYDDASVDYAAALYSKPVDKALADSLVTATSSSLQLANSGTSEFESGVLSKSSMPASISEGFFVTSSSEATLVNSPGSQRLSHEADGLVRGVLTYFAPNSSPSPS